MISLPMRALISSYGFAGHSVGTASLHTRAERRPLPRHYLPYLQGIGGSGAGSGEQCGFQSAGVLLSQASGQLLSCLDCLSGHPTCWCW